MVIKLDISDKNSSEANNVKIVLNMIVKNESKIILRLLESVYKIIDGFCICDTGSKDDTIDKIKNFFKEKNITGYVIKHKFKDFGYNRNWSLNKCRILFDNFDFILLLDADMKCIISDKFIANKESLKEYDYYYIIQKNQTLRYQNIRLINLNETTKYIGKTHEYLQISGNLKSKTLEYNDFYIEDVGDGNNKKDKFKRDIKLLKESLNENPNDVRSHFYLANSYFDTEQYEKALKYYKNRIKLGGWEEEIFYSIYRVGIIYLKLKKYEKGVLKLMNAYQLNPTRAEPLYEIIKHYRISKNYNLANLFFRQAILISEPTSTALFVNLDVYRYKLIYEFFIFYFYLNIESKLLYEEKDIHKVFLKLIDEGYNIGNVFENYKFYISKINTNLIGDVLKYRRFDITSIKGNYNSSSAALIDYKGKHLLIIRYVNYYIDNNWKYKYRGREKTKNYLTIFNDNMFSEKEKEILINEPHRDISGCIKTWDISGCFGNISNCKPLVGLQDIRLIQFKNEIYYTGNVIFDNSNKNRFSIIEHGKYNIEKNTLEGTLIKSPKGKSIEKNWAMFANKKKIYFIYSWCPLEIHIIRNGKLIPRLNYETPKVLKHVSGSTPGVPIDNNYWFITHFKGGSNPSIYYHIFVLLDIVTYKFYKMSYPFSFEGKPIEYCIGMAYVDGHIHVCYSVRDNSTKIIKINPKDVELFTDIEFNV